MTKLKDCVYGGRSACIKQGGDGSRQHGPGYKHPYLTSVEFGTAPPVEIQKSARVVVVPGLDSNFDDDKALEGLSLYYGETIHTSRLAKSLYDFDVQTKDGIVKLLEVLPILDPVILSDVMEEVFPGYVDTEDPDLMRAELKGILIDQLKQENE